ncbi:unnamed protein product [Darwinula stevensoni]|uniref:BPTI/Kunitz inhibitor domain-containing protein n=1 Tax=Darwinula stevensoni TaxID=69355 RepID=A0A7R8ZXZ1_9CRUS|nr:unnamed protein product [Darwinula stevensoni]CAG0880418.1 unnamed protein product [Darwinula stevensoni]
MVEFNRKITSLAIVGSMLAMAAVGLVTYYVVTETQPKERQTTLLSQARVDENPPNWEKACRLPKEVGPCRALIPMIYWNPDTGQCEGFDYGGCLGNDNRFETQDECLEKCGKVQTISASLDHNLKEFVRGTAWISVPCPPTKAAKSLPAFTANGSIVDNQSGIDKHGGKL